MLRDFYDAHRKPLRYCTTCPKMCRFACPVAHAEARETVTPWGLMSLLHAVTQGAAPLDAATAAIFSRCTGCLRCQSACKHAIAVPETVYAGRALAREHGYSASKLVVKSGHAEHLQRLDGAALGFAPRSAVAFFAGCAARRGGLERVHKIGRIMRALHLDVSLIEDGPVCCGEPSLAAGKVSEYEATAAALSERMQAYDVVVTDCAHLLALRRSERWGRPWRASQQTEVIHWTEVFAEEVRISPISPQRDYGELRVVYHDACALGRGAGVYEAPRAVLRWALGRPAEELDDAREWALCCGHGGGYADASAEHAHMLATGVIDDAARAGTMLVTASTTCAQHLAGAATGDQRADITVRELIDIAIEALEGDDA